jgi:hypothetical protein
MCNNPVDYDYNKVDLIQRLKINCQNDDNFYNAIVQGLEDNLSDKQLLTLTNNIKASIGSHFREQQIEEILSKASTAFKYNRDKIKDINQFLSELQAQLDPLQADISIKDPAIISEIDIGNDESMLKVFSEIKNSTNGNGIYKLGWGAVNKMTQGGLRQSEFILINALQHKYKTGFTLSLFKQIAMLNKPLNKDPNKKPLLLRISFEDELTSNLQFLYQSIKYDETREYVDIDNVSIEEMSGFVKDRLQVNGFQVKMMRVDPTLWSYRSICNKVLEMEAQGYVVEILFLDYLNKVPTTGCVNTGATGTDIRDQFRRIRNFASPRKTTVITPHQLSTEAKQLLRTGIPEDQFVKVINEKGYYSGCKQLDQEIDLELYIHLFKHNKETYLSIQRGKHRLPTIIHDEDDKYCIYKFPKGMPIPNDLLGEDSSISRLSSKLSNASDDLFE